MTQILIRLPVVLTLCISCFFFFCCLLANFLLSIARLTFPPPPRLSLKCFDLMSEASSDLEEVVGNLDEILKKVELAICEELDTDLHVSSSIFYTSLISV